MFQFSFRKKEETEICETKLIRWGYRLIADFNIFRNAMEKFYLQNPWPMKDVNFKTTFINRELPEENAGLLKDRKSFVTAIAKLDLLELTKVIK